MAKQTFRSAGKNHSADIKNANRGTKGTNITYDKNQGNRGKQLNPNQKKKQTRGAGGQMQERILGKYQIITEQSSSLKIGRYNDNDYCIE